MTRSLPLLVLGLLNLSPLALRLLLGSACLLGRGTLRVLGSAQRRRRRLRLAPVEERRGVFRRQVGVELALLPVVELAAAAARRDASL
jgi:hypothetical protein